MIGFPPTSPYRKKKTFIFFSCSFGLHLSLILILFLLTLRSRTLLVPESGIPGSIRVDLVALPTELAYKKTETSPKKFAYQESKKQKAKLEETIESLRKKVEQRKGNILSRGGTQGEGKEHRYITQVTEEISENLRVPAHLSQERNRFVIFIFFINADGSLKDIMLDTSSGLPEYDSFVLEAIQKTAPFEPPPTELIDLLKQGISIKIYPPQGR